MNPNDVLDAYLREGMRYLPAKDRADTGFELQGLLRDLLTERSNSEGRPADDAMVLVVLRNFGTPTEIAAQYAPPRAVIIPAHQTRSFAALAVAGIALK